MQIYHIDKAGKIVLNEMIMAIFEDIAYFQNEQKKSQTNYALLFRLQLLRTISWFEYLLQSYIVEEQDINQTYLIVNSKKLSNSEKFNSLRELLSKYDLKFKPKTIKNFETMIYLRNYITHGAVSNIGKENIQNSFFNKKITEFNKKDIEELNKISRAVLSAIFMLFMDKIVAFINIEKNTEELLTTMGITKEAINSGNYKDNTAIDFNFLQKIEQVEYMEDFFDIVNHADSERFKKLFQSQNEKRFRKYLDNFLLHLITR